MKSNDDFRAIQIRKELHGKIKSLAALNDIRLRELASEIIEELFQDEEKIKEIIKKLKYLSK